MREAEARLAVAARTLLVAALMMAVAAGTAAVKPKALPAAAPPDLDSLLPEAFGEWRRAAIPDAVLPQELDLAPGEAVAYRAYRDAAGRVITLVVAYGPPLGDSVRLHRPESCYVAQGYEIRKRTIATLSLNGGEAAVVRLAARSPTREEAVSYWLRSGASLVTGPASVQMQIFRGDSHLDGALVRVSSSGSDPFLFDLHAGFLTSFAAALGPEGRQVLLGEAS
jgi:EpsI family protein